MRVRAPDILAAKAELKAGVMVMIGIGVKTMAKAGIGATDSSYSSLVDHRPKLPRSQCFESLKLARHTRMLF